MYKEFNAFNRLESQRFILLQKELSKFLHNKMRKSIRLRVRTGMKEVHDKLSVCTSTVATNSQHVQDLRLMFQDMVCLLNATETPKQTQGEQALGSTTMNEDKALVLHTSEEKSSKEDTSGLKETNDEPSAKKLKFLITTAEIPSPIPLKSLMPEPPKYTEAIKMTLAEFTDYLAKTTSSNFSPTPPRVPTPTRDKSKGKAIATKDPLKEIMPFMEEGGSVLKISSLKSFVTPEGPLSKEDVIAQLKEIKRLVDLKYEESLKQILRNSATIKAQKEKMAEHESKRAKMLREYNDCINLRANELPITKISYRVNSSKEASMRITRANDSLNVIAKALGIPPPPELSTFGLSDPAGDKKRKRSSEILEEVFVKENVEVDGMHKNLVPPPRIEGRQGLVIREPELQSSFLRGTPEAEEMFRKLELTIEAKDDVAQARIVAMEGLSECKASESNIKRIQVKDIVKEVEDHLKKYSSAGMDISWYAEGIR
ncbi:hypothetical protein Tco_1019624 [Tanacetum coccineum]|uniref:Uncharacterized protein n=1 Tax=Tanacetum coccineum TaxID=301880 RepID=A0ABQ5FY42_9ASTR